MNNDFDEIKSWNNTQQEAMLGETYWAIKEELEEQHAFLPDAIFVIIAQE